MKNFSVQCMEEGGLAPSARGLHGPPLVPIYNMQFSLDVVGHRSFPPTVM